MAEQTQRKKPAFRRQTPGTTCSATNAHEMIGDLLEEADILSNKLPTKLV